MNKQVKFVWQYAGLACLVTAVTFLFFYAAGFNYILEWNKSLRSALTGAAVLTLAQAAAGRPLTHGIWRAALLPYGAGLLTYGSVLIMASGDAPSYDAIYGYYMGFLFLASVIAFLLRLAAGRENMIRRGAAVISACIQTGIIVFAAVYAGYFSIFGDLIHADNVVPILQTHTAEAVGFAIDRAGFFGSALAVLFPVALFIFFYLYDLKQTKDAKLTGKFRIPLAILLCALSLWQAAKYVEATFPYRDVYGAYAYIGNMQKISANHEKNLANFRLTGAENELLSHRLPGTVIFVIGESETRDRMKAFTPSYGADDTHWLSAMKETKDFYLMDKAYSNFPVTVPALSMALYGRNQYDRRNMEDVVSIIDVARAAGYRTYWLSNHAKMTAEDSPIDFAAFDADKEERTKQITGPDGQLLELLKQVPPDGNNFIVLHIMGSHIRYDDRLPAGYPILDTEGHDRRTNVYDTTVKYTDDVLRDIFTYARDHLQLQTMIYFSDHGENMERSHVSSKNMTYDMVRIPLFIYLSPAYQAAYPDTASHLLENEHKVWTNDLAFDTISGLLHAPNTDYDSRWDLTSGDYSLTKDRALTKHGEWRVADDPEYEKET